MWFFEKAQIITPWSHNNTPKGHQHCWTFKSHKETFTTWTKETGRNNILSYYTDKPLENSGFQIICWATEKLKNPDFSSGNTDFSSTQVINLCLAFPDSFFLITFCSGSLLLPIPSAPAGIIFPISTWLLFSCFCISKPWQSSWIASSLPVSQISSSVKLSLPSSHWKDRETSERICLASVSGINIREALPSSWDGALEVRSHSMPRVSRKHIYKLQWDNANIIGYTKMMKGPLRWKHSLRGNFVVNYFLNKKGFSYCTPDSEIFTCTTSFSNLYKLFQSFPE